MPHLIKKKRIEFPNKRGKGWKTAYSFTTSSIVSKGR